MVVSLATLTKIDLNKFERITAVQGKELPRKNSVAHLSPSFYCPHNQTITKVVIFFS